jgi:ribosomal protein L11 methyltransferase
MLTALVLELQAVQADRLSDALLEQGALSVTCEDAKLGSADETPWFGQPGESPPWPRVRLTALSRTQDESEQLLLRACHAIGILVPDYRLRPVPDRDWVSRSRDQFGPVRVSERLWIVPTWHSPPEPGAINLILDPGLAFGTGTHATTRLCLQWLERTITGGETILDYGCGSGILAIAALRLGARRAVGVDIDPGAVAVARASAERNGVAGEFLHDCEPCISADVLVASILANPLKLLAPAHRAASAGRLALSGILAEQANEEASYRPFIAFAPPVEEEGWVLPGVRQ